MLYFIWSKFQQQNSITWLVWLLQPVRYSATYCCRGYEIWWTVYWVDWVNVYILLLVYWVSKWSPSGLSRYVNCQPQLVEDNSNEPLDLSNSFRNSNSLLVPYMESFPNCSSGVVLPPQGTFLYTLHRMVNGHGGMKYINSWLTGICVTK